MKYCKHCHKDQVVPVLDKKMEQQPRPGNKYRSYCLSCERWLPMCSAKYFRTHPNPHILPIDEDQIVPLSESEGTERYTAANINGRGTESSDPSQQSDDVCRVVQNQELQNEILIECVLELTLEGIIDKETAARYLAEKFNTNANPLAMS